MGVLELTFVYPWHYPALVAGSGGERPGSALHAFELAGGLGRRRQQSHRPPVRSRADQHRRCAVTVGKTDLCPTVETWLVEPVGRGHQAVTRRGVRDDLLGHQLDSGRTAVAQLLEAQWNSIDGTYFTCDEMRRRPERIALVMGPRVYEPAQAASRDACPVECSVGCLDGKPDRRFHCRRECEVATSLRVLLGNETVSHRRHDRTRRFAGHQHGRAEINRWVVTHSIRHLTTIFGYWSQ